MPTYHFHTENGECLTDPDGTELPDLLAVRHAAVQHLVEMLRDRSDRFWETGDFAVIVTDDEDLTLFRLQLTAIEAAALSNARLSL